MRSWIFISVVLLACSSSLHAQKQCTESEAKSAESEASTLSTWGALYKSYQRYTQCDDGAIGEGYSATVAHLLADNWSQFDQLRRIMSSNKGFAGFVLRHIDELMSPEQERTIHENASKRCPTNGKSICRSILSRLNAP
jgi:hypothetical protein